MTRSGSATARARNWLRLAAAPTFALMALLTVLVGDGHAAALCSQAGAPLVTSMLPMYLLMAVFNLTPWLKATTIQSS